MKDLIALLRKKTIPLFHWIIDYALQLTEIGKQKRTEINTPAPRNREIMTGNKATAPRATLALALQASYVHP